MRTTIVSGTTTNVAIAPGSGEDNTLGSPTSDVAISPGRVGWWDLGVECLECVVDEVHECADGCVVA